LLLWWFIFIHLFVVDDLVDGLLVVIEEDAYNGVEEKEVGDEADGEFAGIDVIGISVEDSFVVGWVVVGLGVVEEEAVGVIVGEEIEEE